MTAESFANFLFELGLRTRLRNPDKGTKDQREKDMTRYIVGYSTWALASHRNRTFPSGARHVSGLYRKGGRSSPRHRVFQDHCGWSLLCGAVAVLVRLLVDGCGQMHLAVLPQVFFRVLVLQALSPSSGGKALDHLEFDVRSCPVQFSEILWVLSVCALVCLFVHAPIQSYPVRIFFDIRK